MQLQREARGVSASSSSSSSASSEGSSPADLQAFLLAVVCPKYAVEDLKGNKSALNNIMQMSTCMTKL